MVKGWPKLSPRGATTADKAVRRISSEAERTSRDEVTQKLGRIITPFRRPRNRSNRGENEQHVNIEMLLDDILLEIFDLLRLAAAADRDSDISEDPSSSTGPTCPWCPWEWHRLVHVCRRWRSLVFASQHRLDLRLVYSFNKPARLRKTLLDSWQTLPISVWYPWQWTVRRRSRILEDENNASFALRHPDRIREINLFLTSSLLSKFGAQLLVSFPALEYLRLEAWNSAKTIPALPVGFLGGSTPRLRDIHLTGITFPEFPLLLSSTRDLVSLRLEQVSRSGYFSPKALSIGLSMTTQLKSLHIHFLPFASGIFRDTGSAGRSLKTCAILPALFEFHFSGDSAYLDDLISRIDAPVLEELDITFFEPSEFETVQPFQFISRSEALASPHLMSILFWEDEIWIQNQYLASPLTSLRQFHIHITPIETGLRVSLSHILLTRLSALLYGVQRLEMKSSLPSSPWLDPDEMHSPLWLDFFRKLKSVTRLEVAGLFLPTIESVLEQLPEEVVRRVLPALDELHVGRCQLPGGPIQRFANARQSSGRPLAVHFLPSPNIHLDDSHDHSGAAL